MRLYKDIVVDLYHPYPLPVMEAKQYDTGRSARVTLTADSAVLVPTDETVRIYVKKPDGTAIYATCTLENDYILVDFPDQAFVVSGNDEVELYLEKGDDIVSTPIFELRVYQSNMNASGITSSDDFAALVDALRDVETLKKTGLKGDKGDAATIQIGTVTASNPGSAPKVTNVGTANAAKFNFVLPRGDRGSAWYCGTSITGTNTTGTVFPSSGVLFAMVYDKYLNKSTGDIYTCVLEGEASVAKWSYIGNIKGPQGQAGTANASSVAYNNTASGMQAENVQDAIDELEETASELNEKIPDVANNLTTTNPGYYLDARQGKILADKIVRIQVSGTTDGYGLVVLNINTNFTQTPFALTNIGDSSATPYIIMVQAYTNTRVVIRVRSFYDATAVANTSVNFAALLIGV